MPSTSGQAVPYLPRKIDSRLPSRNNTAFISFLNQILAFFSLRSGHPSPFHVIIPFGTLLNLGMLGRCGWLVSTTERKHSCLGTKECGVDEGIFGLECSREDETKVESARILYACCYAVCWLALPFFDGYRLLLRECSVDVRY